MSEGTAIQPGRFAAPALPGYAPSGAVAAAESPGVSMRLPGMSQVMPRRLARSLGLVQPPVKMELLIGSLGLFCLITGTSIAYVNSIFQSRSIAGVPLHMVMTLAVTLLAVVFDGRYLQQFMARPPVMLFIALLCFTAIVGIVRCEGSLTGVFVDCYTIRWFFVGFMLMRLAICGGFLRTYLVVAAVFILMMSLRIDSSNTMGGQVDTTQVRATSNDLWTIMNLGIFMVGLLTTVTWPHGVQYVVFSAGTSAILTLFGGIRASTRSLFIVQALCLLLCLFALSRDPRMSGRGKTLRRVMVIMLLVAAAILALMVIKGQILGGMTQLGTRFAEETSEQKSTTVYRLREAEEMLNFLTPDMWIFGLGLGIGYWNQMGSGFWAGIPHIAVLGWLMKGGIVVFGIALWSLYIHPLLAFGLATAFPRRNLSLPPPILIVGPPLLSWAVLTFMSGGLDIGSALGLGGLSALWIQLADDDRRATKLDLRPSGTNVR